MSRRKTNTDWLLIIILVPMLTAVWVWTISSALSAHRERDLLAEEGILTKGQVLSNRNPFWNDPATGDIIEYQFADSTGKVWRGQGKGYLSIEVSTGERVVLVTYAPSDPSVNRLGNHTDEHMRRRMETGAVTFPIYLLVVQGGGLSLVLIWLVRRGVRLLS